MLKKLYGSYGRSKQFYWWFSSYALIVILAILINMIGYAVTLRVLERTVEKNNRNAIENIGLVCDNYLNEVLYGAYSVLRSDAVIRLSRPQLSDYERQQHAASVVKDIGSAKAYKAIDDFAVLLRESDIALMDNVGVCDMELAYSSYYGGFYDSKAAWLDSVFSVSGAQFVTVHGADNQTHVFLVYRLPNVNPQLAVMTKLNQAQLTTLLNSVQGEDEQSFIADENGDVLFQSDDSMNIANISRDQENGMHRFKGAEYMVSSGLSAVSPFRYVRMVSGKSYMREVGQVRTAFVLGYVFCVFLTGALAWWFALISDRDKQKLDLELKEQQKHLRQNVLKQLLTGQRRGDASIPDAYSDMLAGKYFVVVMFDFAPITLNDEQGEEYDYELLCRYLPSMFSNGSEGENAYFCVINEMCAGLIKQHTGSPDIQKIQAMAEKACSSLGKELQMDVRCAISKATDSALGLNESFEQVVEIINFHFLGDDNSVFVYDDALQNNPKYSFNLETADKLINLLMVGNYKGAKDVIDQQFELGDRGKKMNLGVLRVVAAELISTLLKVAVQLDKGQSVDYKPLYLASMQMNNYHQINEIKQTILEYAETMCNLGAEGISGRVDYKYQKVEEYIKENYANPMLNVNMLADVFEVARPWLSKNFREKIGVSMSEYIVKYRLEKAKELLRTDMPIAQTATATGFSSEVVYYRAFKKYENITPLQYRQLIQSSLGKPK